MVLHVLVLSFNGKKYFSLSVRAWIALCAARSPHAHHAALIRMRATAGPPRVRATACDGMRRLGLVRVRQLGRLARVRRLGLARVRQLCPHSHACEGWPPFALARSATLGCTETRTHGARKVRYSGLHERARQVRYAGPFGSTRPRTRKVRYSDSLHTEERAIALARAATRFLSTRKSAPSRSQGPLLFFVPPIRMLRLPWMQSTYSLDGGAAHTYRARKVRYSVSSTRKSALSPSPGPPLRTIRKRALSRSQDSLLGFFPHGRARPSHSQGPLHWTARTRGPIALARSTTRFLFTNRRRFGGHARLASTIARVSSSSGALASLSAQEHSAGAAVETAAEHAIVLGRSATLFPTIAHHLPHSRVARAQTPPPPFALRSSRISYRRARRSCERMRALGLF
ncbi:hypothetical protein DFH11DRAFT_1547930 [Phellopilus nigrolimitatus]|nr:hypothetical protein DFH11DRAFT_1547930 [Phellopilus nigrolimitatus]